MNKGMEVGNLGTINSVLGKINCFPVEYSRNRGGKAKHRWVGDRLQRSLNIAVTNLHFTEKELGNY